MQTSGPVSRRLGLQLHAVVGAHWREQTQAAPSAQSSPWMERSWRELIAGGWGDANRQRKVRRKIYLFSSILYRPEHLPLYCRITALQLLFRVVRWRWMLRGVSDRERIAPHGRHFLPERWTRSYKCMMIKIMRLKCLWQVIWTAART